MGSVNHCIFVGNLGQDVDLKYTQSNKAVANFTIACNDSFKDNSGQRQERVEWVRITAWGATAENCSKYLKKGRSVYVEGRLQTRSWDDKNGQKRYTTEIVAEKVVFLGGGSGGDEPRERRTTEPAASSTPADDSDIPF